MKINIASRFFKNNISVFRNKSEKWQNHPINKRKMQIIQKNDNYFYKL